jgi:hypothetical protein
MPGNNNAPLGVGGVVQILAAGGMLASPTLPPTTDIAPVPFIPQPNDIARGPAGNCCVLCGKVGIDLPIDHNCRPNIDIEAYRAQVTEWRCAA